MWKWQTVTNVAIFFRYQKAFKIEYICHHFHCRIYQVTLTSFHSIKPQKKNLNKKGKVKNDKFYDVIFYRNVSLWTMEKLVRIYGFLSLLGFPVDIERIIWIFCTLKFLNWLELWQNLMESRLIIFQLTRLYKIVKIAAFLKLQSP